MLVVGSALKGYAIEASDGRIGSVKNFLFDDTTWKIRWLVVDTGHWLSTRLVLVHPSAIGTPDHGRERLPVQLTRAQVEASPDIQQDRPVTMQMQNHLYNYYGWDPTWGPNYFGTGMGGLGPMATFSPPLPYAGQRDVQEALEMGEDDGDPDLRSMVDVTGYHIHATDGTIGHLENFLIDDVAWAIRYLIVDTRNWWPGEHVLISPYAVNRVDWTEREILLDVMRERVKSSPKWDPVAVIDELYQHRLHSYYDWPGYGW